MKNILFVSHRVYVQEKYYSLLSELQHAYKTVSYYSKNDGKTSILKDIKTDIEKIVSMLKETYYHSGYGISKLIDENLFSTIDYFIYLDVHQETLEKASSYYGKLHAKMLQYLSEGMVQQLPQPSLQKRYSSKVLSDIIDKHTQTLFDSLSDNNVNINILSNWSHEDVYRITHPNSRPSEANSIIGSHSIYYHDLIWAIPAIIDHEVIMSAIRSNKDLAQNIENSAESILENFRSNPYIENDEDLENKYDFFFSVDYIEEFLYELYAGWIAFDIYGNTYKYAFFHEALMSLLGRDFFNDDKEKIAEDYIFSPDKQRDMLICRSMLTIFLSEVTTGLGITQTNKSYEDDDYVKEVGSMLRSCFILDNETIESFNIFYKSYSKCLDTEVSTDLEPKASEETNSNEIDCSQLLGAFKEMLLKGKNNLFYAHYFKCVDNLTYRDDENFKNDLRKRVGSFISFMEYSNVINAFTNSVAKVYKNAALNTLSKQSSSEERIFNQNKKETIKNSLKESLFFIEDGPSLHPIVNEIWRERFDAIQNSILPHRSLLRKKLMRTSNIPEGDAFVMVQRRHKGKSIEPNAKIALGYFDEIEFKEKEASVTLDGLEKNIKSLFEIPSEDETYFETKHALLKIDSKKEDSNKPENADTIGITMEIVLQIYLDDSSDLKQAESVLRNLSDKQKLPPSLYVNKDIYKSLGPEDFVCLFAVKNQTDAWRIVEAIETFEGVRDTYMTIMLKPDGKIDKEIWIKQLYRLNKPMSYDNFRSNIWKIGKNDHLMLAQKLQIFDTEGGYDFELWWNVDNFEPIKNTYNEMINTIDTVVSFVAVYQKPKSRRSIQHHKNRK